MRAVTRAADCVLPQEIGGQRAARQSRRDILFIKAVARFVQGGENRHGQVVGIIAGCDADIVAGEGYFERMGRDIKPAALEVKADQFRHLVAERHLRVKLIFRRPQVNWQGRVIGDDSLQKRQQAGFEIGQRSA